MAMCTFEGCVKQAQHGGRCLRHQEQSPAPSAATTTAATTPPPASSNELEWEDPPAGARRGRKSSGAPIYQALAKRPGRWAVLSRTATSSGTGVAPVKAAAKAAGDSVEAAVRPNDDGTFSIWLRVTPKGA